MENYFKKGAQVIYHYQEWHKVYWSDSGYGWVDAWKRAVAIENPRDEEGRFVTFDEVPLWGYHAYTIKLKDEDGKIFTANMEDVEKNVNPASLSEEQLKKLRREICGGSLFFDDYKNSLGVFQNVALVYWEGFWEYLREEYVDEEIAEKHDTPEEFAEYCRYVEWCGDVAA